MQLEPIEKPGDAQAFQFEEKHVVKKLSDEERELMILATVVQDLQSVEQNSKQLRLDANERLFLFEVKQQYWNGTPVPRSSLGVPFVLEHVTTLNEKMIDVLFEEDPPFHIMNTPGNHPNEARAMEALVAWALKKAEVEEEIEAGGQSGLLHGTGVWKGFWHRKGDYLCPKLEYIERKHVFVDPSLRKPDIRKAKWVAHRMYLTPRQLDKLRSVEGYKNIPSLQDLAKLGVNPKEEAPLAANEMPNRTFSSMTATADFEDHERRLPSSVSPYLHPLEVIEYCDDKNIYTVLQRKILIRESKNEGRDKVEYYSAYFVRVPGQFDGMGVAALNGNDQLLQQGIINLMLDHLSISLLPIMTRKNNTPFSQNFRISPGKVFNVTDKDDISVVQFPSIDMTAFEVVSQSEARGSRRTGANETTVQGAFPESSGGIGRTAFGMNLLAQGSMGRIKDYVRNIEQQVLLPFIEFIVRTIPKKMDRDLASQILGRELGEAFASSDLELILKAGPSTEFEMLGATKMKRRAAMLQAVPVLLEYYGKPEVLESLKYQFKKLDYNQLNWLIFDATGWPIKESLILDMDEAEQQQVMSENPLMQQLMLKQQEVELETKGEIAVVNAENEGRAARDLIKINAEAGVANSQQAQEVAIKKGELMAKEEIARERNRIAEMGGQVSG